MGLDPHFGSLCCSLLVHAPLMGDRDLVTAPSHQASRPSSRAGLRLLLVGALLALGSVTTSVPATAVPSCPTVGVDGTVTPAITPGADLSGCNLTGANLTGTDLTNVDFDGANLTNAVLTGATLVGVDMTYATLWGVRSGGITPPELADNPALLSTIPSPWNLSGGFLLGPGANLAEQDLTAVGLTSQQLPGADLTGADLSGRDLSGTNFENADLSDADLSDATLTSINGVGANFTRAVMTRAHLQSSDYSTADMTDADLSYSTLVGTGLSLNPTGLSGANFTDATLTEVVIAPFTYSSTGAELTVTGFYDPVATEMVIASPFSSASGFSVTAIADGALNDADAVETVTFPESLVEIGDYALQTTPLTTITFLGDVPNCQLNTFDSVPGVTLLYRWTYRDRWREVGVGYLQAACDLSVVFFGPISQVTFSAAGSGVSGTPATSTVLQTGLDQPITVSGQGTLSRPGYSFAGWSTSFDGPPVGSTYLPTQDTVLYSTWTANPSGGGSPTTTSTMPATTPPATTTVSVVTPPGASPTTVNRGQAAATIGGVPTEVTRTSGPAGGGFSLTAGSMAVRTTPPPTGFSAGGSTAVTMSGFAPDSSAGAYLFSEPVSLGTLTVDAGGAATGRIVIPASVPPGDHTLQFTGWTPSGEPVILSAGVTVKPEVTRVLTPVPFADGASILRGPGRAAVRRAVAGTAALAGPWRTTVAYPEGEGHIGRKRARAVASALRSGGLTGPIRVEVAPAGRRTIPAGTVTITTTRR